MTTAELLAAVERSYADAISRMGAAVITWTELELARQEHSMLFDAIIDLRRQRRAERTATPAGLAAE